jgi:hypothetical protein
MGLAPGVRLGPYEIVELLGAERLESWMLDWAEAWEHDVFVVGDFGLLCQVAQEAWFERLVSMHGDRKSHDRSRAAVDVVTAMDSKQNPAMALHNATEVLSRGLFQTAISIIRADFSSDG